VFLSPPFKRGPNTREVPPKKPRGFLTQESEQKKSPKASAREKRAPKKKGENGVKKSVRPFVPIKNTE